MPQHLKLHPDGEAVEFYSLLEIARLSGRTKNSLFKLTSRKLLPEPNFRLPDRTIGDKVIPGQGLYSATLVPHILNYLEKIERAKKVNPEHTVLIFQQFYAEREQLLSLMK